MRALACNKSPGTTPTVCGREALPRPGPLGARFACRSLSARAAVKFVFVCPCPTACLFSCVHSPAVLMLVTSPWLRMGYRESGADWLRKGHGGMPRIGCICMCDMHPQTSQARAPRKIPCRHILRTCPPSRAPSGSPSPSRRSPPMHMLLAPPRCASAFFERRRRVLASGRRVLDALPGRRDTMERVAAAGESVSVARSTMPALGHAAAQLEPHIYYVCTSP